MQTQGSDRQYSTLKETCIKHNSFWIAQFYHFEIYLSLFFFFHMPGGKNIVISFQMKLIHNYESFKGHEYLKLCFQSYHCHQQKQGQIHIIVTRIMISS